MLFSSQATHRRPSPLLLAALMVASAIGFAPLTGCTSPTGPVPSANQPASSPEAGAAQATSEELSDERDMGAYDAMADEVPAAGYRLQSSLGARIAAIVSVKRPAKAKAAIGVSALLDNIRKAWLEARQAWRGHLQARFNALGEDRAKLVAAYQAAPWVPNPLAGTKTKTFSFTVEKSLTVQGESRGMTREVLISRTVTQDERVVISTHIDMQSTWANGMKRTSSWEQALQADGSTSIAYSADLVLPNGATREVDWSKTVAADGSVTGSGSLKAIGPNGSTRTRTYSLSLGGRAEQQTVTCRLDGDPTVVEVRLGLDGEAIASTTTGAGSSGLKVSANAALGVDASI